MPPVRPVQPQQPAPQQMSSVQQGIQGSVQQKPPVQQAPQQVPPVSKTPQQPPAQQPQQPGVLPVVGWIVCVKGEFFGKSFSIVKGKNTVGSGSGNSIVLEGAKGVEKASHTWIAFDMNMNFFVLPGMSDAFVNGMLVTKPKYIKFKDIITIGEGEYMLVPLCGKDFDWKTYGNY